MWYSRQRLRRSFKRLIFKRYFGDVKNSLNGCIRCYGCQIIGFCGKKHSAIYRSDGKYIFNYLLPVIMFLNVRKNYLWICLFCFLLWLLLFYVYTIKLLHAINSTYSVMFTFIYIREPSILRSLGILGMVLVTYFFIDKPTPGDVLKTLRTSLLLKTSVGTQFRLGRPSSPG